MPETVVKTVITTPLEGVTTAIVLFLFACLAMPHLIKNRTQYYVALWCAIGIIIMNTLGMMIPKVSFIVLGSFLIGILQIIAVVMLVMCAGGMDLKSIAGEMKGAYEVIRRGEEEKEVIIPLTGQKPRPRDEDDDDATPVININTPAAPPAASTPPPAPGQPSPGSNSSIPLD